MGKLDAIKKGAIDDGVLDNINGGANINTTVNDETLVKNWESYKSSYDSKLASGWNTSTNASKKAYWDDLVDTLTKIWIEIKTNRPQLASAIVQIPDICI